MIIVSSHLISKHHAKTKHRFPDPQEVYISFLGRGGNVNELLNATERPHLDDKYKTIAGVHTTSKSKTDWSDWTNWSDWINDWQPMGTGAANLSYSLFCNNSVTGRVAGPSCRAGTCWSGGSGKTRGSPKRRRTSCRHGTRGRCRSRDLWGRSAAHWCSWTSSR